MKKLYILAIFLLLPLLCSCQHSLAFGSIERDQHQIGGNLSFVYNPDSQTATFGGEGEVVQFYGVDLTKAGKKLAVELASNSPHHLMLKVLKASAFLWTAKKIPLFCNSYI